MAINNWNNHKVDDKTIIDCMFDQTFQFMGLLDLDGYLLKVNKTPLNLIGLTESDVVGRLFWETPWWTHSVDVQNQIITAFKIALGGEANYFLTTHVDTQGNIHYIDTSIRPIIDDEGDVTYILAEGRDVTELKKIESELRTANKRLNVVNVELNDKLSKLEYSEARLTTNNEELTKTKDALQVSLDEKMILVKEVHHRVKNNLQIIISIINLQLNKLKDTADLAFLKEIQNRIYSIATVHESLYKSNLTNIDFSDYVDRLLNHLLKVYSTDFGKIKIIKKIDNVNLGVDKSISCGLLITEIVSNALKYAFPEGRAGKVKVEFVNFSDDGRFFLRVSDNGVGLPTDFDEKLQQTLGTILIRSIAAQLGAEVKCESKNGVEYSFIFTN